MENQEIAEGVKKSLENARSLLSDAKLLIEEKSAGHALFLVVSAIEETSKALIYAFSRVAVWNGKVGKDVVIHFEKLSLFISHLFAAALEDSFKRRRNKIFRPEKPVKPLGLDDVVEMAEDFETAYKELWKTRNQALYVDRQNGKWTSPRDFEKTDALTLLKRAERYIHETEFQTRNILQSEKSIAIEFAKWLRDEFVPQIANRLLDNIDELYNDGVITLELYNKIKTLRQKKDSGKPKRNS